MPLATGRNQYRLQHVALLEAMLVGHYLANYSEVKCMANSVEDLPVTCGSALYCATTSTYVGCCESTNCVGIFTTCYDFLGNSCDVTCQNNPENLVW